MPERLRSGVPSLRNGHWLGVLVWGFDESRQTLAERRDELAAFLRAGGVFLGFRCSEDESWLLGPAARGLGPRRPADPLA